MAVMDSKLALRTARKIVNKLVETFDPQLIRGVPKTCEKTLADLKKAFQAIKQLEVLCQAEAPNKTKISAAMSLAFTRTSQSKVVLDNLCCQRTGSLFYPSGYNPPDVKAIANDIQGLISEFSEVGIVHDKEHRYRDSLYAVTKVIEFEGVVLGSFAIHLIPSQFSREVFKAFRVVALQPCPHRGNPQTTHPYVNNEIICLGDGVTATNAALKAGRIFDAFMLAKAVLENYDSGSNPYAHMAGWLYQQIYCNRCGTLFPRRAETTSCKHCLQFPCSDTKCRRTCELCQSSVCTGCITPCKLCKRVSCNDCRPVDIARRIKVCPYCSKFCSKCNASRAPDRFLEGGSVCLDCIRRQELESVTQEMNETCLTNSNPLPAATIQEVPIPF